jgi:hypothetical protein
MLTLRGEHFYFVANVIVDTEVMHPPQRAAAIFRLLRALLPLGMLWVSKLIIDAVVGWISRGSGNLAAV